MRFQRNKRDLDVVYLGDQRMNENLMINTADKIIKDLLVFGFLLLLGLIYGCKSPAEHRKEADIVSYKIIEQKQLEALGRTEPFTVERPSDLLRRRILLSQRLKTSGQASVGADQVDLIAHWPEEGYPYVLESAVFIEPNEIITLSLLDALQVGAQNSFEYQSQKEGIFASALNLDLERNEFRSIFDGTAQSYYEENRTGHDSSRGFENSGGLGISQTLMSGAEISAGIAAGLVNLLNPSDASSLGLQADSSITIPLLRGSGRHIVTEPLVQAERDVIYAIWEFEQYKHEFAVNIASRYLEVLRQQDRVINSRENYISAMTSARQSRRLADAGRLPEIQVDQAVQRELDARAQWIGAVEGYKQQLDSFKTTLGLPPDARIELDRADLEKLEIYKEYFVHSSPVRQVYTENESFPAADAGMEPQPPTDEDARPLELPEEAAIQLAFENRLDLRIANGRVYDAQREVVFRADRLRAELTLLGAATFGSGRSLGSADSKDAQIQFDKGVYSALLTLDLPLERTAERNAYRNSYLAMEESVRTVQQLEDSIKLSIRNELRNLLESREQVKIQALAVTVAEKRQKSTKMFLDAGRAEIRDLLDAQDSLLSAQNQLTAAIINYRIAELNIQRDMGVLQVDQTGLWKEFNPEELNHDSP